MNGEVGAAYLDEVRRQFRGLLVGNFGDGTINAFNPTSGSFRGTLSDGSGNPLMIDGVWGIQFGNGGNAGPANRLYFTAGPGGESHGLFGALDPTPEPGAWLLSASGLAILFKRLRRQS